MLLFNKALQATTSDKGSGYGEGQKVKSLAEYIDIYPTLCDLAGISRPRHLDGTSLVDLMKDTESAGKEYIISRYKNMEAIKTDQYLYTEWIDSAGNVSDRMLYDHQNDPEENVNIAGFK